MADKTSTGQTIYQGRVSNSRKGFGRGRGNSYGRGQGCGFNTTKPKVRGKCEALGSNIYLIGYAQKSDKYTKTTEVILN